MKDTDKRRKQTPEHIQKRISSAKKKLIGRKLSEEHKRKISENNGCFWKGKPKSEEVKKKISESKKGNIPWNKGLTKEDSRVKEYVEKSAKTRKGMSNWRKGTSKRPKGYAPKYIQINGKLWKKYHYIYCREHGLKSIPKGYCIHHIDQNPLNNEISNLALMKHGEHSKLHIQMAYENKNKTNVA